MKYFNKDIESVLKELDVDLEIGLNDSSIRERTEKYGKMNLLIKKKEIYLKK